MNVLKLFSDEEVAQRVGALFGPEFSVVSEWDGENTFMYELSAWKGERRVDWLMSSSDLLYEDEELVEKFVGPAKACLNRVAP